MNFRDLFSKRSIRQLIFVVILFALLIPIAIWDSNTQVDVDFYDTSFRVRSDRYGMTVNYDQIASVALEELPDAGEKVQDGFDNDIVRTGTWTNAVWGEYCICADLDADNCVVMELDDGRIFVFSCKNSETTAEYYEELKTHVN